MRILYISHLHPPADEPLESIGGMQRVSMQLVEALGRREDVEVDTIIQQVSWDGIEVATTVFLFKLLALIPRRVREFKPDVILFSSMVTAGVIPFLPRSVKVPMVVINHGQDVTLPVWIYQKYLQVVFDRLDGVISVSKATRQACIDRGMDPRKGIVLPNGLDNRRVPGGLTRKEAREKLEELFGITADEEQYLLLTVGRQVKRKGHSWFISEVLPRIRSNVNYLVIGDGPEFEAISEACRSSEVGDRVTLAGRQSDEVLKIAYAGADLFVMPNVPVEGDMEGFGVVLLEANQSGMPAVASDLEGIRDVIQPGVNGYRIPHSNPALFAKKIDEVLEKELKELSQSSKKFVLDKFSWDSVIERYIEFLGNFKS